MRAKSYYHYEPFLLEVFAPELVLAPVAHLAIVVLPNRYS